jgi:type IV secretory pathway VirB6-like protein
MKARIDSFTDNWLGICISVIVGLVAAVAGFLIRRSVRREAAKA